MAMQLSDLDNDMKVMDYVVSNLLKQGKKSQESILNYDTDEYEYTGDCVYRGFIRNDDGEIIDTLKCAVGHIISDEAYDDQLESYIKNMNTSDNTIAFVAFTPYGIQKIQWTLSVIARDYYDRIDIMEWDHFHVVQKKILTELINEIENLEFPTDWRPKDVLALVLRKLKEKEESC